MKFSMTGQENKCSFNTDDCLIEVTTWAGLTVYDLLIKMASTTKEYIFVIQICQFLL